jgi:hypothetical protein
MRMLLVARNHADVIGSVLRIVITPDSAVARSAADPGAATAAE